MDFQEQKNIICNYIDKKEFDLARKEIYKTIENAENKNIEDEQNTYLCFNSYLELMLYVDKYNPKKPNKAPKTNMAFLYYMLGYINFELKEYDEALKNLNEALKWNPVDLTILFEKAEVYKALGDLERFKAEVEKTYQFITANSFLAKYYRMLGYYYIEKKVFNVANALHSRAFDFAQTEQEKKLSFNELVYIAQQENREPKKTELDEIKKIFEDYNIPISYSKRTVSFLLVEYQRLLSRDGMSEEVKSLSRILYEITQDKQFMITYSIKDEETGISIKVPENWGVLRKSEYEKLNLDKNTLFIISTDHNETVSVVIDNGECGIGQFTELYKKSIENMKDAGITILAESSNIFEDGFKLRQAVVEVQEGVKVGKLTVVNGKVTVRDKKIRMIQNYVRANNKLVNISWIIPKDIEPKEMIELLKSGLGMQMVMSVRGDKDRNVTDDIIEKAKTMNYDKNIWRMPLEKLDETKGVVKALEWELQQRIEKAEDGYINPFYIEQKSIFNESANDLDKMIEWKKYLEDVNEVSVTMGKDIFRIKTNVIKHFSSDNTLLDTRNINIEEFKNIIYNTLCYMYDWNKSYIGKELVDNLNWSILIKSDKHDMKRFSGNNSYPITWNMFHDNFVYAIEKSDLTFFDELFIKSLIYLVIATQEEKDQNIITCLQLATHLDLEQMIKQLPLQHPARVLFKTLDSLTDIQYAKLLVETKDILVLFTQYNPEESKNILYTISSEQDVDKVASKIVNYFKDYIFGDKYNYDKMEAVAICMNDEYSKNGINQAVNSYIEVFVDNIIETNEQDRYWSDSAREFLALLILANLVSGEKVSLDKLKNQTVEIELPKKMIKENIDKFNKIPEVKEFMGVIDLLDSDKPFKSLVEITNIELNKYKK